MANIIINDILDELRDENNRLFNENKVIYDLLIKYRKVLFNVQNICVCNQKSINDFKIKSLEVEYQRIENQKQKLLIKTKSFVKNSFRGQNNLKKEIITKKFKTKRKTNQKKVTEDIDSDCDVNEENDTKFSSYSDEEIQTKTKKIKDRIKSNFKEHKTKYSLKNGRYLCDYIGCGKSYVKDRSLWEHIQRIHTLEKPYKCEECLKCFVTPTELKSHQKVHMKQTVFKCEECHKEFNGFRGQYLYDKHKDIVHSSQPIHLYKCRVCPFETRFESYLKVHITVRHKTNERTVKCDYEGCHKMFRNIIDMKSHKRKIHTTTRFSCDWPGCEYITHCKNIFGNHRLIHIGARDFKCDFDGCDKSFVTGNTLRQHKLTHLKKFVCSWPECGQGFSEEVYLTAHMNKHLNLRPFKCYINDCNKDFKIDRHLKHHIRVVHKTKPK